MTMAKCEVCSHELPTDARFCPACGSQTGVKRETFQVSSERLVEKFRELARDADVKRVTVKDEKGKVLLSVPFVWGAAGAVATLAIAPWLAALGVIAGVATKCTVEVEKITG